MIRRLTSLIACAGVAAVMTLTLAGCASIGPMEAPGTPKSDALDLVSTQALSAPGPDKLAPQDLAILSAMHDVALVNCLYYKNRQATLLSFGSTGLTDGDLLLASIAPALALTKISSPGVAAGAAVTTLFATQLKSFVGLPAPANDFSQTSAGMDYVYATFSQSPGVALMMADTSTGKPLRLKALKAYRIGLQQACITNMKMPAASTAIYTPAKTQASTPTAGQ